MQTAQQGEQIRDSKHQSWSPSTQTMPEIDHNSLVENDSSCPPKNLLIPKLQFLLITNFYITIWRSTVNKDLLRMGITWEEAEVAAQDRSEWCRSVAQCIHLDEGWIKIKVKVKSAVILAVSVVGVLLLQVH